MRKLSLALLILATAPLAARSAHAQGDGGGRPTAPTVGIGLGIEAPVLPAGAAAGGNGLGPNVSSVRVVLAPNMILEPIVSFRHWGVETEQMGTTSAVCPNPTGQLAPGSAFRNMQCGKQNEFIIGAQARFVLGSRGPVDFAAIGGLAFVHRDGDPGGNISASSNSVALDWGFGLTWYFAQVWSLSMDAINPALIEYTKETGEINQAGMTTSSSTTSIEYGISHFPKVRLMLHLYF